MAVKELKETKCKDCMLNLQCKALMGPNWEKNDDIFCDAFKSVNAICKNCIYFHPRTNEKGWGDCDIFSETDYGSSTKETDTCHHCVIHK